jgi:hypothetical protein
MFEDVEGRARGGHARAAKLSAEERSAIAKRAAKKRWSNIQDAADDMPKVLTWGGSGQGVQFCKAKAPVAFSASKV